MARKPREEYAEGIYHIIQRGNNREFVFELAKDKDYLIECLQRAVDKDEVEIFAYVVMGNHYNLVLRSQQEPLGKAMQRINTRYSVYYNRKNDRTGHVFEGPYKASLVDDERYLLALIRYIHRNPVRAGLCDTVEKYMWSSDHLYRKNRIKLVQCDFLLDILANERGTALEEYQYLMELGDEGQEEIRKAGILEEEAQLEAPTAKSFREPLDKILLDTGISMEQFKQIKDGSRKRDLICIKKAFAKEALKEGYKPIEIGEHISLSKIAVYEYLK